MAGNTFVPYRTNLLSRELIHSQAHWFPVSANQANVTALWRTADEPDRVAKGGFPAVGIEAEIQIAADGKVLRQTGLRGKLMPLAAALEMLAAGTAAITFCIADWSASDRPTTHAHPPAPGWGRVDKFFPRLACPADDCRYGRKSPGST